ncbi:cytochrome P450 [Cristinia sonorae]|uniref:Cytochrome P450 n=1 Tax=Cristinia sonorae TaxID=1940300 RepID=A0A8K0USQ7_9AGAR|nr:cytochrome P450 [Cristinia sonorae]
MASLAVALTVPLAVLVVALWKLGPIFVRSLRSPLRRLPGPPSPSWIWGQFKEIFKAEHSVLHEKWIEQYGHTISYAGMFGSPRLYTHDERALNHIMTHSMDYQKPETARFNLTSVLGAGVLVTEGEQHRQQRRIMNPAFGPAQIRDLTSIFLEKSVKLRDLWQSELDAHGAPKRIDVLFGLSRMTLDVIGVAGFNYDFNALDPSKPPNELNSAFKTIFMGDVQLPIFGMLRMYIPALRLIPTARSRKTTSAMKVMHTIGMDLIREKKAAILAEKSTGGVEKRDLQGRDLLTLLIKANMATDIPESQRLSDEDVLAQVPTFIVAGHETTSTAVTWCLYALTQAPHVQTKLRDELLSVQTEMPTMDELNALPYLDMVVKETLRVHAPVAQTVRVATRDDEIPVGKPYRDRYGVERDSISVAKGDFIMLPILAINRSKTIWGEDAHEFKPERWVNPPEAVSGIPGVWGHLMTFIGGPRACIGYRFSLIEMKALLFVLVRAFEYELAVKPEDVTKKTSIVQRPLILSEVENGSQMPLLIRPYRPAEDKV